MSKFKIGDPVRYLGGDNLDYTTVVFPLTYVGKVTEIKGKMVKVKIGNKESKTYREDQLTIGLSTHTYRNPLNSGDKVNRFWEFRSA